ncbi:hypothetical protein TL16_g00494 [Triparma laevis f. inornata]|uniref:Uncharacterized protein n=1 Tax=Triparma laevis f. inornata TaxID=1714386 RepID=A0A9W6ZBT8_9STRA|nr:hypothetical protein TL16_g00494 [Triparma laevis f. inornata]
MSEPDEPDEPNTTPVEEDLPPPEEAPKKKPAMAPLHHGALPPAPNPGRTLSSTVDFPSRYPDDWGTVLGDILSGAGSMYKTDPTCTTFHKEIKSHKSAEILIKEKSFPDGDNINPPIMFQLIPNKGLIINYRIFLSRPLGDLTGCSAAEFAEAAKTNYDNLPHSQRPTHCSSNLIYYNKKALGGDHMWGNYECRRVMGSERLEGWPSVEIGAVEGPSGLLWQGGDGFEMKIIQDLDTAKWVVKDGEWEGVELTFETDGRDNVIALKIDGELYVKRQPPQNPPHPSNWATTTGNMNCEGHISGDVDFTATQSHHPHIRDIVSAEKFIEDRSGILNPPVVWSVDDKGLHIYWRRYCMIGGKKAENIAKHLPKGKTNVYYAKKHEEGDDIFGRYVVDKDQIIASPEPFMKNSWTLRDGKTAKRRFCDGGEVLRNKKGEIEGYKYDDKVYQKVSGFEMEEDEPKKGCCVVS